MNFHVTGIFLLAYTFSVRLIANVIVPVNIDGYQVITIFCSVFTTKILYAFLMSSICTKCWEPSNSPLFDHSPPKNNINYLKQKQTYSNFTHGKFD